VTADLHFGHERIVELCNRPFKNVTVMDNQLIKTINNICGENDDLYVLGDASLKTAQQRGYWESCLQKIKCRVHLICGNHEAGLKVGFLAGDTGVGFFSIHYPYLMLDNFCCVHDPSLALVDRNIPFLCGHIHDAWKFSLNALNVGVDVWNFKPLPLAAIRRIYKTEWKWFTQPETRTEKRW
jgi:calcineurin-like phosphoesterase family protein